MDLVKVMNISKIMDSFKRTSVYPDHIEIIIKNCDIKISREQAQQLIHGINTDLTPIFKKQVYITDQQIYDVRFVSGHTVTDRLPALCRRRRPPTISNGDGQFTL